MQPRDGLIWTATVFATEKVSCDFDGETTARFKQQQLQRSIQCLGKNHLFTVAIFHFEKYQHEATVG